MARQDDYVRYTIRVPQDLYEKIKAAAGEKSVNAEIVARLEYTFEAEGVLSRVVEMSDQARQNLADAQNLRLEREKELERVRAELERVEQLIKRASEL